MGLLLWLPLLAAGSSLDAAEAALKQFDAKGALTALKNVERAGKPLSLEDHVRYHAAAGIAHAYLERQQQSLAAFGRLLVIAPGHVIPYTLSPRVTFLFQKARQQALAPPSLDVAWPRDRRVEQALPVVVEVLADPRAELARAKLFWREGDKGPFRALPVALPRAGRYVTVDLPPAAGATTDRTRQLYLSAYDKAGHEIARLGGPARPREVTQRYVEPTRWYERWWVWAIAGTVAAAVTATTVYAATRPEPENVGFGVSVTR